MTSRTTLKILFGCILATMLFCTGYASLRQPLFDWGGLTRGQDRYWTIATMGDAYFGFLTFYLWVFYKEPRRLPRIIWFIAIMAFGNMAMATYVLIQLSRLRNDEPASNILMRRNG